MVSHKDVTLIICCWMLAILLYNIYIIALARKIKRGQNNSETAPTPKLTLKVPYKPYIYHDYETGERHEGPEEDYHLEPDYENYPTVTYTTVQFEVSLGKIRFLTPNHGAALSKAEIRQLSKAIEDRIDEDPTIRDAPSFEGIIKFWRSYPMPLPHQSSGKELVDK